MNIGNGISLGNVIRLNTVDWKDWGQQIPQTILLGLAIIIALCAYI